MKNLAEDLGFYYYVTGNIYAIQFEIQFQNGGKPLIWKHRIIDRSRVYW